MSAARRIVVALVGALALAGCGAARDSAPTPNGIETQQGRAILDTAYADSRAQTSVHVSGSGNCPEGPFIADLRLTRGGSAVGSISFPPVKLDVVVQGTALYIKAPASFWSANLPGSSAAIGAKWVRSTNPNDNRCVRALTSYSDLLANFLQLSDPVSKHGTGVVLAKPVVTLETKEATVFVSTTGDALPVRVDSIQGVDAGSAQNGMSFGEWNVPVAVSVPPPDQTVDVKTLLRR